MNGQTTEVAKEITSEISRLEREAERLGQVLDILTDRLIPVMHGEHPKDANEERPSRQTPLGIRIDAAITSIRYSSDRIEELTARLEI